MYRVTYSRNYNYTTPTISKMEVVKKTAKTIVFKYSYLQKVWDVPGGRDVTVEQERREQLFADGHCWFETFEEAKDWVIGLCVTQVESAKSELNHLEDILSEVKAMEE